MKSSLKKNFFYQASYEILIVIMPLITSPYISRVLGAEQIGVYSYTYTIANYFVLFCALGIKNYGNREIAKKRSNREQLDKTFSSLLFLHFIISAIVGAAYVLYIVFFVDETIKLYAIIQSLYIITAFFDISWFFFGIEQFKITVTRNIIVRVLILISIFVFVKNNSDLIIYIIILALGNFFSQIYLWFYVKKHVSICKVSTRLVFSHLPKLLILFIPTIAISLYNYMDKIMVGNMAGKVQLGFYENSEKIIFLATNVIASVGTIMLPRIANLVAHGEKEKINTYLGHSMQIVMCMACGFTFGLSGISNTFAPVFFGKEFAECSMLIMLLSITLPFKGFANVLRTQYLIPNSRDKEYVISVCSGAVINILMNLLLIPHLHATGAAIGTIAAEVCVWAIQFVLSRGEFPLKDSIKMSIPFLIFGTIMFGFVYIIGLIGANNLLVLVIQIIVGICIYGGVCVLYFIKTKNKMFYEVIMPAIDRIKRP